MLQTVKKGSSLHVVGEATARIGEAAPSGAPGDTRERPSRKAPRAVAGSRDHRRRRLGEPPGSERRAHRPVCHEEEERVSGSVVRGSGSSLRRPTK
ncbi:MULTISPECIES: hypothetical protein [Burkholderia]|uniref:hypothetical protein n=1 Tax=Burkholderia TaxID=32008 RepID=UPI0011609692|nr:MULTISPECIES: hypothetical protein [Burkholderia]